MSKPSSQARYNRRSHNVSAIIIGESIIDSWKRTLSPDDVERAVEILRVFGLDVVYGRDPMPNAGSVEKFMGEHGRLATEIPAHEANR
jgi:hypothetical protein